MKKVLAILAVAGLAMVMTIDTAAAQWGRPGWGRPGWGGGWGRPGIGRWGGWGRRGFGPVRRFGVAYRPLRVAAVYRRPVRRAFWVGAGLGVAAAAWRSYSTPSYYSYPYSYAPTYSYATNCGCPY